MSEDLKKLTGEQLLLLRVLQAGKATDAIDAELDRRALEGGKPPVEANIASRQHGSRAA